MWKRNWLHRMWESDDKCLCTHIHNFLREIIEHSFFSNVFLWKQFKYSFFHTENQYCLTKTVKLFRDVKNFGLEIEMEIFRTPWNFINIYPNLIELERENITAEYWFVITKNCLGFIISVVWSWQCHEVFMWQK